MKENFFDLETKAQKICKYVFSEDEIKKISADMAEAEIKCNDLKSQLKDVQTQLKADIQAAESTRTSAAIKIRSGYEMRDIDCILRCFPKEKKVEYVRVDTLEIVDTRPAREDELQMRIA